MAKLFNVLWQGVPRHIERDMLHSEQMITTPEEVSEILAFVKMEPTSQRCNQAFQEATNQLSGFSGEMDDYSYNGYSFHIGLRNYNDPLAGTLELMNQLKINAAPRLTDHILLEINLSLLVSCYRGCSNSVPLPCKGANFLFTQTAKNAFLADMQNLLDNNLVHPYSARSLNHWLYHPDTGSIYLDSWSALRTATIGDSRDHIESVKGMLARLPEVSE